MFASDILEVIYAPHKAFKKIVQNPRYIGPAFIMVLVVLASVGLGYVMLSKSYIDQTAPPASEQDEWTEDTAFWNSSGSMTLNNQDRISGYYYGNNSIQFSMTNCSAAWIQLNLPEPLNFSAPDSFTNVSLRIKLVEPSANPSNATLYLTSSASQGNFSHDLADLLNESGVWSNLTIPIGSEWAPSISEASWGSITGLRAELLWPSNSNVILLVDGIFFHGFYRPAFEAGSAPLLSYALDAFMQYATQWLTLGSLLYVMVIVSKVKTAWKPLLIISGFALVTLVIEMVIKASLRATWPEFYIPLKVLGSVPGEWEALYGSMVGSFWIVWLWVERGILMWTAALCAIALRTTLGLSWAKSGIIASLSSVMSLLAFHFLSYGGFYI